MERDKLFFRCVLLHYFDLKKSAAKIHRLLAETYGECLHRKQYVETGFDNSKVVIPRSQSNALYLDTGASTSEARKELSSDTCADLRSGRIGKAHSRARDLISPWGMRESFEEIDDTYISGSISVSQQNITKLEREAGRHANQVDKELNHIILKTVSTNNSQDFTLVSIITLFFLVYPNVRFTYKRCANAPPADNGHVPPPLPQYQPHHRRPAGTDVRTRSAGAQVCVFFYHPLPPSLGRLSIRSFIRKNTHLDRPDRASVNAAPNRGDPGSAR
ncbi:hypothetical protein ALC62_13038 [Cyphomyrmex costatus]|uniref:Mos1 transposase HTH domain-containing protein n=1 Tax=Cyphomyrmex costatus TaxID=456900 RepID=A0A195C890_9HYME|nr:hypothetical protein ALC62_13038 [Cyphomyrmex costatus]